MCKHTAEHTLHIAIQNRFALVKGKGGNRGGRASAHAAQRFQGLALRRKYAAKIMHHLLGGFVQIAGAAVVAQARPQIEHIILRRGGQRGHIGKAGDKARIIIEHGGHLGLLQHDFREPHPIRLAHLPRQMVAAMLALPGNQALGEIGGGCHRWAGRLKESGYCNVK